MNRNDDERGPGETGITHVHRLERTDEGLVVTNKFTGRQTLFNRAGTKLEVDEETCATLWGHVFIEHDPGTVVLPVETFRQSRICPVCGRIEVRHVSWEPLDEEDDV